MNTHEMLKEICDKIGYTSQFDWDGFNRYFGIEINDGGLMNKLQKVDVREIIFTQEFVDKFITKLDLHKALDIFPDILSNLDNPVTFLYNLMK